MQLQMKRDEAAAFVRTIKGPQWGGAESTVAVNVDPGMLAAMQRATLISPAWLAACTSTMGTSLNSMAVLAANNNTMQVSSLSPEAGLPAVCNAMLVRILNQHHHDKCQTRLNNAVPVQTPCAKCTLHAYDCISVGMCAGSSRCRDAVGGCAPCTVSPRPFPSCTSDL